MRRKRIVIVHNWTEVGINIQNRQLAYELSKAYDVWFLTAARIGQCQMQVNDHLTVMEWPHKRPTRFKDLWFCWLLFRRIKPDVVMAHFTGIRLSMMAAFFTGVKHRVAWYHVIKQGLLKDINDPGKERVMLMKYKFGYLWSNRVVTFNKYGKEDAARFLGKRADRFTIIPNGMMLQGCAVNEITDYKSEPAFLFLGRLHYLKGLDILIDCFEKLKEEYPHVKLKVVGSGEMEVIWKERIQSSGLSHIIELYGKTSRYEEVFEHLRNAYALLVPSRADNFPNVIIEAFACGVPVIASKSGGIPEMLTDGVNGFLCECENQNDWMKKIEYLIRERKCRNTMAVNARRQYEEKFTMERHVNNVSNFLETL